MPVKVLELGVKRSAPWVSMGRRRPWVMRLQRKAVTAAPGEDKPLMQEKLAWASESLCLKWLVVVRAGESQYPSQHTTWKRCTRCRSSSMGAVVWEVPWLEVSPCMS